MPGIMVAIEGIDLVGKTTIAKALSNQKDWSYYRTPPKKYFEACVRLNKDGRPVYSKERFQLFIECLVFSSQEIMSLLKKGISVATDRWVWTTLAYHFAFNENLEKNLSEKATRDISTLLMPHISFLVHIFNEEVYEYRKSLRKVLTPNDKMVVNDKAKRNLIFNNFKRLNQEFVLIDNSKDLNSTLCVINKHIDSVI